jgi:hypothetical protein
MLAHPTYPAVLCGTWQMSSLQDQLSALVGHSGTVSPGAVVTVICCLLVVNAVFYLGFMHLIYHILLRYHMMLAGCASMDI